MTRHLSFLRTLSLSLGITAAHIAPSFADTRAPLQVGVTVRPACQISSRQSPATLFPAKPNVTIRCPRGVPYALSISPLAEPQPVATHRAHAQTLSVIF